MPKSNSCVPILLQTLPANVGVEPGKTCLHQETHFIRSALSGHGTPASIIGCDVGAEGGGTTFTAVSCAGLLPPSLHALGMGEGRRQTCSRRPSAEPGTQPPASVAVPATRRPPRCRTTRRPPARSRGLRGDLCLGMAALTRSSTPAVLAAACARAALPASPSEHVWISAAWPSSLAQPMAPSSSLLVLARSQARKLRRSLSAGSSAAAGCRTACMAQTWALAKLQSTSETHSCGPLSACTTGRTVTFTRWPGRPARTKSPKPLSMKCWLCAPVGE
mmetsp:Transcript_70677/g.223270  ORF Transcript_70677/g.223270 Transcript_70677/m.223270 type:complete len:276 (-) Transcript_70677:29-856(-)